jgi:hypothetical protein
MSLQSIEQEWLRRVQAEYGSAVLTHHLTLWLLQIAAPAELVRLGLRIVDDELVHAELSQAVSVAAGGHGVPSLPRDQLGLRGLPGEDLELAIARVGLETFCLGETAAVRLFGRLRKQCDEPSARAALDRVIVDEVRHREFGWTLLEWQLSTGFGERIHALAVAELPAMFQRLKANYAFSELGKTAPFDPEARRWGLMPSAEYAEALQETFERDYRPRFAEFDIDAECAWNDAVTSAVPANRAQ